jgi:glycerol-3-phosphate O-acyltransferase
LGRIIKAVQIFSLNLGTIYLDFCEPIQLTTFTENAVALKPEMNPYDIEKDKLTITNDLGLKIVQEMQTHVRIMPPNLVASIILL